MHIANLWTYIIRFQSLSSANTCASQVTYATPAFTLTIIRFQFLSQYLVHFQTRLPALDFPLQLTLQLSVLPIRIGKFPV